MSARSLSCLALLAGAATLAQAENLTVTTELESNGHNRYTGDAILTHRSAGAFTDTLSFSGVVDGTVSARLASAGFLNARNIDFTSVSLNGQSFSLKEAGPVDFARFASAYVGGPLVITVSGIAAPDSEAGSPAIASYGGRLSVMAVPEATTGAMLLAGLGVLGLLSWRRSRR